MSSDSRSEVMSVRFTAEELDRLRHLSGEQPVSVFIRRRALEDAAAMVRACELCPTPIFDNEYRARHISEQSWTSPFHAGRWLYAHERCYQKAIAAAQPPPKETIMAETLLPLTLFTGWLASGERGISSDAIVAHLTGERVGSRWHAWPTEPADPADLRRCERLMQQVPLARFAFPSMRTASPAWARLVDEWDELVALLEEEAPGSVASANPSGSAPRLFARLQHLRAAQPEEEQ